MFTVCRVKLDFSATVINEHPFTEEAICELIQEASQMIQEEEDRIAQGGDPEEWDSNENKVSNEIRVLAFLCAILRTTCS